MTLSDKRNLLVSAGLTILLIGLVLFFWKLSDFYKELFQKYLNDDPFKISAGGILLIFLTATISAFALRKAGFQKTAIGAAVLLAGWWVAAVISATRYGVNLMFFQGFTVICLTIAIVQIQKLWEINEQLAGKILSFTAMGKFNSHESPESRIDRSIKLLQLIFPLSEAIVFRVEKYKPITVVGRLKTEEVNLPLSKRQSLWHRITDLAMETAETSQIGLESNANESGTRMTLPLVCDKETIGVLYVDVKQVLSNEDKTLLQAFSDQLARNFQRRELKEANLFLPRRWKWLSTDATKTRLTAANFVNILLTEESYSKLAASHLKEAHAVALLDGTITQMNRKMRLLAKATYDESLELDIFTLLNKFKTNVFNEPHLIVRRVLQSGNKFATELFYPDTGKTLDLQIALVKIPGEEDFSDENATAIPVCFLITVNDITTAKENEKLRSETVSLMSHELRTPITSIKGFAELMLNDENIPKESAEFLEIISRESQRLSKMVSSFLSVSNLEQTDKKEVYKTPIHIDKIISEVIENSAQKAKRKRIHLAERTDKNLPLIAGDKALITNAIKNLLENAITYSPEKTSITISAVLESENIRVTIEDRGYGIPTGDLEKVWEKFYRVKHEGLGKENESTGLGLPYVKEAIEQHGGKVFVESEINQGSKFGFTLPRL